MSRSLDHLLNGAIATLREAVLPQLADANARANLFSVLQVLELLALQVDWAAGPLEAQLAVRQAALATLPASAAALWPAQADRPGTLLEAIDALDARVAGLIERVGESRGIDAAGRGEIERWALAYAVAANAEELRRVPRSQLGQLTSTVK